MQRHGQIMQLFLGIHCIFDFLLGLLIRVGKLLGSIVAAAGLQGQFLRVVQLDLQGVEAAVGLEILRSEAKNVGVLGSVGKPAEALIEVVVVVKEHSTGAICQNREQI